VTREFHQICRTALLQVAAVLLLAFGCNAGAESRTSVAVLPFSASIDNEELKGLDRALSEMLITDLTALQSIEVVERNRLDEVFKEIQLGKDGFIDPSTAATIGKGVGAKTILTGSFFAMGDKLRIDARLIHVETGTVLLAEEITGSAADPFDLEKRLQQKLVEAMGLRLSALEKAEIATKPNADAGAAAAFGRAQTFKDEGDEEAARREAERALRLSPDFNQAKDLLKSLDERVGQIEEDVEAVKEVRLKRVKESEDDEYLFKFLKDPEIEVRREAVARLKSHSDDLTTMARNELRASEASGGVVDELQFSLVMTLVNKIDDEDALSAILSESAHPIIKAMALSKLKSPDSLKKAFLGGMGKIKPAYRYPGDVPTSPFWWWNFTVQQARKRVTDQEDLLELCKAGDPEFVKLLKDDEVLRELASSIELDGSVRSQAQSQLESLPVEDIDKLIGSEKSMDDIIRKEKDPSVLMRIAVGVASYDSSAAEFAVGRIFDEKVLRDIALSDAKEALRKIAVYRISDPAILSSILEQTKGSEVGEACADTLRCLDLRGNNDAIVDEIRENCFNDDLQVALVGILDDQAALKRLVSAPEDYRHRLCAEGLAAAVAKVSDQSFLADIVLNTSDNYRRRLAFDRIMELPDWDDMNEFFLKVASDTEMTWRTGTWNSTEMSPLFYGDRGDGRWGLYKYSTYMQFPGETETKAYELGGALEPDPGVERRRKAFVRVADYPPAQEIFILAYDDSLQQQMAEKLGEDYACRAISLALREKRFVAPSLIEACDNQDLINDYLRALSEWEDNIYGNVAAALAERALLSKSDDASLLLQSALSNVDPVSRDISLTKINDKELLARVAVESQFFNTQRMAKEKLARLQ
jgi:TolB-like protein